ncbi:hypothetical protein SAMN03080610_00447 [Afifella marina DSM 2698]|uniref:Uncharacterized protein n=1 Tax=Afifella marina DSM 2698 TaxID=1120955 RepID=A0A1G5MD90_AFIMA|nr:hypothetical protein SAMN03080610_00447 [Afifella marina DSM 2698]
MADDRRPSVRPSGIGPLSRPKPWSGERGLTNFNLQQALQGLGGTKPGSDGGAQRVLRTESIRKK